MSERLQSAEGARLYRLRKTSIEPVFGIIKVYSAFGALACAAWTKSTWSGNWSAPHLTAGA